MKTPTLPLLIAALTLAGSGSASALTFTPYNPLELNVVQPRGTGLVPNVYPNNFEGPLMPGSCRVKDCLGLGIDPLSGKPMTALPPEASNGCTPWHPPCKVPEGMDKKNPEVVLGNDKFINYGPNGTIMICYGTCHMGVQTFQRPEDVTDPDYLAAKKAQKQLAEKAATDKAIADANKKMWGKDDKGTGNQTQSGPGAAAITGANFDALAFGGDDTPPADAPRNGDGSVIDPTNGNIVGSAAPTPPQTNDAFSMAGDIGNGDPSGTITGGGDPNGGATVADGNQKMSALGNVLGNADGSVAVAAAPGAGVVGFGERNSASRQLASFKAPPADQSVFDSIRHFLGLYDGGGTTSARNLPIAPTYRNTCTMGSCPQNAGPVD